MNNAKENYTFTITTKYSAIDLFHGSLRDIDNFTTKFADKYGLFNFLTDNIPSLENIPINGLLIYDASGKMTSLIDIIYKDRIEVTKEAIVTKINRYFQNFNNLNQLEYKTMGDTYLKNRLDDLKHCGTINGNSYLFKLENIMKDLAKNYKESRNLSIIIDKHRELVRKNQLLNNLPVENIAKPFLVRDPELLFSKEEKMSCLNKLYTIDSNEKIERTKEKDLANAKRIPNLYDLPESIANEQFNNLVLVNGQYQFPLTEDLYENTSSKIR